MSESKALGNGSFWSRAGWGAELRSETGTQHPLLKITMPVEAEMLPLAASQSLIIGDGIANNIECKYRLEGDVKAAKQKLDRELWVNSDFRSLLYIHSHQCALPFLLTNIMYAIFIYCGESGTQIAV